MFDFRPDSIAYRDPELLEGVIAYGSCLDSSMPRAPLSVIHARMERHWKRLASYRPVHRPKQEYLWKNECWAERVRIP